MIIFDENIERYWINLIQGLGFPSIVIAEMFPGISDRQVVEIVKSHEGLLITEDKDFGELIFAFGITKVSVILLRYDQPQYDQIEKSLLKCIKEYFDYPTKKFITISKTKIREITL
jgi:predicted nuclease of predicted toxin-antitoxin system